MAAGILEEDLKYRIVSPYCPLIVIASVFIFYGFTLLNVNRNFTKCSNLTFFIYLVHAGVWELIQKLFSVWRGRKYLTDLNGALWIAIFVILVFVLSYYLSKCCYWIWRKMDRLS